MQPLQGNFFVRLLIQGVCINFESSHGNRKTLFSYFTSHSISHFFSPYIFQHYNRYLYLAKSDNWLALFKHNIVFSTMSAPPSTSAHKYRVRGKLGNSLKVFRKRLNILKKKITQLLAFWSIFNWESVEGCVIQATRMVEFEDGLCIGKFYPWNFGLEAYIPIMMGWLTYQY